MATERVTGSWDGPAHYDGGSTEPWVVTHSLCAEGVGLAPQVSPGQRF
jgi:hypothetical protein